MLNVPLTMPPSNKPAQLSSHQGSLSALRRQLAAAQDEQGKLAEQLRTGLATAGEAAAAGDQISTEVGGVGGMLGCTGRGRQRSPLDSNATWIWHSII